MAKKTLDDFINTAGNKSGEQARVAYSGSYGNYDLVIFGENHVSKKHLEEEIEIVKEMKPGYLLLESLGDAEPERLETAIPAAYIDLKNALLNRTSDEDDRLMIENALKEIYSKELAYLEDSKSILNAPTFSTISESEARELTFERFNELRETEYERKQYLEMRDFITKHKTFDDMLSAPIHEFPTGYLFKVRDRLASLGQQAASVSWLANSILSEKERMSESGATDLFQLLLAAYKADKDVNVAGISPDSSELFSVTYDERTDIMGQRIAKYAFMAKEEGKNTFVVLGANHVNKNSPIFYYLNLIGLSYKVLTTDPMVSDIADLKYNFYIESMADEWHKKHRH